MNTRDGKRYGKTKCEVVCRIEQGFDQQVIHQLASLHRQHLIALQVDGAQRLKQEPEKQCQDGYVHQDTVKRECGIEFRSGFCQDSGHHKTQEYEDYQEVYSAQPDEYINDQVFIISGCAYTFQPIVFEKC
ncbi:hypothetical protein SDC9_96093 [bioreactor metagenome]|uniref:Uncharacterized protein n=1 Tax=bioreactor metagenome TaxID=1076179 RepID=A0A645AI90_9ZZZZ